MEQNAKRTLPHVKEAEESLLGCLLMDIDVVTDYIAELTEDDFYFNANKIIIEAMKAIYTSNRPIDLITLVDALEQSGSLAKVNGMSYLSELSVYVPSTANAKHYFDIVKRDSLRRKLIRASSEIIENSFAVEDKLDVLSFAEKQIFDLSTSSERNFPQELSLSLNEVVAKFDENAQNTGGVKGIDTGYKGLNKILNGLHRSDLVLIAARPGEGKSSLAMNLVENVALAGYKAAVFSLEMPKIQIAQRMICSNARVSMERANKGTLTREDWEKIWDAKNRLSKCTIFIDDNSSTTPPDILSKCRRIKAKTGLDLIMIDYVQLMSYGGKRTENRQQEISDISRSLKIIAKEIDVPVLALSQLSRQIENRIPPTPQLSDLRDSGAIEQDADIVMFIHNPNKKNEKGEIIVGGQTKSDREIIIAKHRNGKQGEVKMKWIGDYVRFEDDDAEVEEQVVNSSRNAIQGADEASGGGFTSAFDDAAEDIYNESYQNGIPPEKEPTDLVPEIF